MSLPSKVQRALCNEITLEFQNIFEKLVLTLFETDDFLWNRFEFGTTLMDKSGLNIDMTKYCLSLISI